VVMMKMKLLIESGRMEKLTELPEDGNENQ
jgi:hypothetical protein